MLLQLLFLLIIFGITYAYLNDQEQFSATASAIHQIWAGNCRLSCRQNESRPDQNRIASCVAESCSNQYQVDPNCICDSCPCRLIDDLLGPYGPVRMNVVEALSHYYYYGLELIANSYNLLGITLGSLRPCQRQAQFVSTDREGSSENFSFGRINEFNVIKQPPTRNKNLSLTKAKSATSSPTEEGTSKSQRGGSTTGIKFTSDDEKSDINSCSRCVSQGKTCMKSCPKSKK